jgi:hypothetical protein
MAIFERASKGTVRILVDNPCTGRRRCACTFTCAFDDGRCVKANSILDIRDGRIVRQFDRAGEGRLMPGASKTSASETEVMEGFEGHYEHMPAATRSASSHTAADADMAPVFKGFPMTAASASTGATC